MSLHKSLFSYDKTLQKYEKLLPGQIGTVIGGKRLTEVPGRGQFIYVKLRSNQSEVIQAFNDKVFPGFGIPVLVEWNNNRYEVVARDTQRYPEWESDNPQIAKHGATHSLDKENDRIGTDPVWVYPYQFMPSLVAPFPATGVQNVYINPYPMFENGSWKYVGNTGTPSVSSYRPQSGSSLVLVTLDSLTGNPTLFATTGSYIPSSMTGTSQFLSYLPQIDNFRYVPMSYIQLQSGTSSISWDNIYDVRQFFYHQPTGSSFLEINGTSPINSIQVSGISTSISGSVAYLSSQSSSSSTGGFGIYTFDMAGMLETGTTMSQPWLITDQTVASSAYLYCENLGTTGTTVVDIKKNGVSIFTGTSLSLPYNSTGSWVSSVPYYNTFVRGDVITIDVTQKATQAKNAKVLISSGVGIGSGITIMGGGQSIAGVSTITFQSGTVSNLGGGNVNIQFNMGSWIFLGQRNASSSASLEFTSLISSLYDEYVFEFLNVLPATTGVNLNLVVSTDNGASYVTGSSYEWGNFAWRYNATAAVGSISDTKITLNYSGAGIKNTSTHGLCGNLRLFSPLSTSVYKLVSGQTAHLDSTSLVAVTISGSYKGLTAINAIKFLMSSGNISSGTIRMYGIRPTS